jgi:hypothetical protein
MIVYTAFQTPTMAPPAGEISMKTSLALLALLVLPLCATASARDWSFHPAQPAVDQPGHREWAWEGDDGLAVEAPVTVHYSPAGSPRVVATGPAEMVSHIQFGEGRIRVDDDWHYRGDGRVEVTVSGVTVHNVALAGSGRAELNGLALDRLRLSVAGSGNVKADGRADRVELSISGSGDVDLDRVTVRDANIHIAGSGTVRINPRDEANVSITGSGDVRMRARPARLHQATIGSGRVSFPETN